MPPPARPEPNAAARVKDAALDLAGDLTQGIRKADRPAKLRAAIIGTWALLAVVAMWISCPPSGPSNALDARVQLQADSIMGTQILIQNDGDRTWTDVALTLDGTWRMERRTIRGGDKLVLATSAFQRDGQPAPPDLKPKELTIACSQGEVALPLRAR